MTGKNSIQDAVQARVDAGELAGAATLVWRDGAVRQIATGGCRDLVSGAVVERDTGFAVPPRSEAAARDCAASTATGV
jgi:hypothetical protein